VPNQTEAAVNKLAAAQTIQFDFFRRFLGLLSMLNALGGDRRFLSYEEICALYDKDEAWTEEPESLFSRVLANRVENPARHSSNRSMLDIEPEYSIPRDNFAALFGKTFRQTGLFDYRVTPRSTSAIALGAQLDRVLQRRVRFILDHPQIGSSSQAPHLREQDLPEETSLQAAVPESQEPLPQENLGGLVHAAVGDFQEAGLTFTPVLVARLVASLIAKRFVILTGLSGSGKTKLAQAFAAWLSPPWLDAPTAFEVGDIVKADRIQYRVTAADKISVEFAGEQDTLVALPLSLIREWVGQIEANGFTRDTTARTIRDAVSQKSAYSTQLSSFETHLKAAAFHLLDQATRQSPVKLYEIVSVGPDWTSREASFGYVDALNDGKFIRSTPIVDLILKAISTPDVPLFLILDEMNLSHVERYFADFLSAAESHENMFIHGGQADIDGVPASVPWPMNLFVIGTVNVDETTYSFSPKVLDRANTIEFRVGPQEIQNFLASGNPGPALAKIGGAGARFSTAFMQAVAAPRLATDDDSKIQVELNLLFEILHGQGEEFGFRTAKEITRFFGAYKALWPSDETMYAALDAQVFQKLLPKLNGTRRHLEGLLCSLASYCSQPRIWSVQGELENREDLRATAMRASKLTDASLHPLTPASSLTGGILPLSHLKIVRMLAKLDADGFASFAEA
jgi:energy-coupling factor transporter ATP-binding protein EcfA2